MHKVRQLYKRVAGPEPSRDAQKLNDLFEKMAAENSILKARITGLTTAIFVKQKKRKRSKPVFPTLWNMAQGHAVIYSPQRVGTAIQKIEESQVAKDAEAAQKAQEKEYKRN